MELDFSGSDKWSQLKKELGIAADKDREFEDFWKEHEKEACAGRDVEFFVPLIREKFNPKLRDGYSLLIDGYVSRFEANRSIWPVIDEVHRHSRVGLLTNMYPGMLVAIRKKGILPEVSWDVIIDSSVEGVQKPDPAIFKLAESRAGVTGREVLFVENSPGHVEAAANFGWQTFWYDSATPEKSSQELGLFWCRILSQD